MSETLLPCPFCGSEAVLETTIGRKGYDACVFCDCSASVCSVTCDDVSEAEIDAIAAWNRRAEPHWIPVTERLPTECGYYLSVVERIAPDELGGNNTRVKIMRWLGADWRYPTHIPKWINEAITETVTHWMPLPEPPKGE